MEDAEQANKLLIAFVLMLILQLGNRIFGRLMTYPMHNYPSFTNLLSVFIYVPMCFIYIWPMMWFTGEKVITKEQKEIPKYKFAVMGAYDSLAGIMQVFAVNYIKSSSIVVLVQQSAIPINMGISYSMLNAKYTFAQYTGAAVVLFGIVVVLIPQMMPQYTLPAPSLGAAHDGTGYEGGYDAHSGHGGGHSIHAHEHYAADASSSSSADDGGGDALWIAIMVVSCVPMCLSSVYKEIALGEMEIDVVYLNGWVAVFQFLMAVPLVLPSSAVIGMPMSAIIPNMISGWDCYMGVNTITRENQHEYGAFPVDNCADSQFYTNWYILFNVLYNVLMILVLKYGSSNIMWMASTVIVPLSNVAFSLDFMPNHQPLTLFDIVGLVVIMGGLVIYRFTPGLLGLWRRVTGQADDLDDELQDRKARGAAFRAARKQYMYMGFNQMESLNAVFDTRVAAATQKSLFRSPASIRGSLLLKLGIPPSPHIQLVQRGKQGSFIEIKPGSRANSIISQEGRGRDGKNRSRSGTMEQELGIQEV